MTCELPVKFFAFLFDRICGLFWGRMIAAMDALSVEHNSAFPALWMQIYAFESASVPRTLARIVLILSVVRLTQIAFPAVKTIAIFVIDQIGKSEQKAVQGKGSDFSRRQPFRGARIVRGVMGTVRHAPTPLADALDILRVNDGEITHRERQVRDAWADYSNWNSSRGAESSARFVFVDSGRHAFTIA